MAKKRRRERKENLSCDASLVYKEIFRKFLQVVAFLLIILIIIFAIKLILWGEGVTGHAIRDSSESLLPNDLSVDILGFSNNQMLLKSINDNLQIPFSVDNSVVKKVSVFVEYKDLAKNSYAPLCGIENFTIFDAVQDGGNSNQIYYKYSDYGSVITYYYNCSWTSAVAKKDIYYNLGINVFNGSYGSYGYKYLTRVLLLTNRSDCKISSPTSVVAKNFSDSITVGFNYDSTNPRLANYFANITRSAVSGARVVNLCSSNGSLTGNGNMSFVCSWDESVPRIENGTYDISISLYNNTAGGDLGSCLSKEIIRLSGNVAQTPYHFCGNGICEFNESDSNCPQDCLNVGPTCGDKVCNGDEDECSCPSDCPGECKPELFCGDGICSEGETCGTTDDAPECVSDCGKCPVDNGWLIYVIVGASIFVVVVLIILILIIFLGKRDKGTSSSSSGRAPPSVMRPMPPRAPPTAGMMRPVNFPTRAPPQRNPSVPRPTNAPTFRVVKR